MSILRLPDSLSIRPCILMDDAHPFLFPSSKLKEDFHDPFARRLAQWTLEINHLDRCCAHLAYTQVPTRHKHVCLFRNPANHAFFHKIQCLCCLIQFVMSVA